MTDTVEITPGAELDQAVAEAIGCRVRGHRKAGYWCGCNKAMTLHGTGTKGRIGAPPPRLHYYSTDLNAAFAAAEKVRLFKEYGYCEASGQHVISKTVPVKSWGDTIAHEATPALAICAAILKLKDSDG